MRKSGSLFLKVSALLIPALVACAAEDAATSAPPTGDVVEESLKALETRLPRKDLVVTQTIADPDGSAHVKLAQLFQGIPVFEGEVITHIATDGTVTTTDALRNIQNVDINTKLTKDEAVALARTAGPTDGIAQVLKSELVVLPRGDHGNADRLAWHVRLLSEGGADSAAQWDTFYDAHNGKLLLAYDTLETTEARGRTLWSGNVALQSTATSATSWSLVDDFGNLTCDLKGTTGSTCTTSTTTTTAAYNGSLLPSFGVGTFALGTADEKNTAAADAHYGMQKTLEYYSNVLGRNGIDGQGALTRSRVHYSKSYDNAFWSDSCFCMTYGDGSVLFPLTRLDVAGHEMSHGVMSRSANLTYRSESGGLNESSSDIFGTMVEFNAANPSDVPDWDIGEGLYRSTGKALRYMADPAKDGSSPACWSKSVARLDVHYSSGPNNHMFYLLAQNEGTSTPSKCTANGVKSVTGIGRDKAAKIWYRAITTYMTSSTNYAAARIAVVKAATDLFPAVGGVDSPEVASVKAAYTAINVL